MQKLGNNFAPEEEMPGSKPVPKKNSKIHFDSKNAVSMFQQFQSGFPLETMTYNVNYKLKILLYVICELICPP